MSQVTFTFVLYPWDSFCCLSSVPCTRQLQEAREKEKKEFTVLAEFSSVVADTQQYIVDDEQSQSQSQVRSVGYLVSR